MSFQIYTFFYGFLEFAKHIWAPTYVLNVPCIPPVKKISVTRVQEFSCYDVTGVINIINRN